MTPAPRGLTERGRADGRGVRESARSTTPFMSGHGQPRSSSSTATPIRASDRRAAGLATPGHPPQRGLFDARARSRRTGPDAGARPEGPQEHRGPARLQAGSSRASSLRPVTGRPARALTMRWSRRSMRALLIRVTGDTIAMSPPLVIEREGLDQDLRDAGDDNRPFGLISRRRVSCPREHGCRCCGGIRMKSQNRTIIRVARRCCCPALRSPRSRRTSTPPPPEQTAQAPAEEVVGLEESSSRREAPAVPAGRAALRAPPSPATC